MKTTFISSSSNEAFKEALRLTLHNKHRKDSNYFAVEGLREIQRAIAADYCVRSVFFKQEKGAQLEEYFKDAQIKAYEVESNLFSKLVVRESSDDLLVLFEKKHISISDAVKNKASPLILAIYGLEKPGNLGAMIRSADGAGADGVVILGKGVDIFHPSVIRASIGSLFSMPCSCMTYDEFLAFCRSYQIQICAAALHEKSVSYLDVNYKKPICLLIGSEAFGLSSELVQAADHLIKIPMKGISDSLNASVAAGVLLYEAARQR